jgi:hypothetical protein
LYDAQIKDMLDRKVAKKLDNQDIANYTGPVDHLPHHEVLKPSSKNNPT